jgi:hypothetical protein
MNPGAGSRFNARYDLSSIFNCGGDLRISLIITLPSADGSTTIYFGLTQPDGVKRGNWIQTMPGKGWFTILRLYSLLEPFFTKKWRPSEIELVK